MSDRGVFTSELKFILNRTAADALAHWARSQLSPDPNAADVTGSYRTTSLYFDTPQLDVYFRRGSCARAEFRIRRYNDSETVFLERKLKIGSRLSKRRSEAPVEDLARLTGNNGAGSWFGRRLMQCGFRPVCQVAYDRIAYVAVSPPAPLRITFDQNVVTAPSTVAEFADIRGAAVLPDQTIMELKFAERIPDIFQQLIDDFRVSPQSISKYRLAVDALGLAGIQD